MLSQQFYIIANILMLVDSLICIVTGYLAYSISLEVRNGTLIMAWNDLIGCVLFVMFLNNYLMGKFGFYSDKRFKSRWSMVKNLFMVGFLDFLILSTGVFVIGVRPFSRVFFFVYAFLALVAFVITRVTLYVYLDHRALTAFNSNQILLVGTRDRVAKVNDALESQRSWGHRIAGILNVDGQHDADTLAIPVLGNLEDFDRVLGENHIDEVIFALPKKYPITLDTYLHKCEKIGVAFRIIPGLYDTSQNRLRAETLQGIPTLATHSGSATASGLLYKRVMDLVAGLLGFLVFLIIYPVVALIIKLDSPGPVLFKQCRVGRNNRKFWLYKFRTMVAAAESKKQELLANSEMSSPMFKMEDDPRITRVGKFLRKTSLDEFPQFINVLKGEMSLVGTRPPTPDEVEQYQDEHRRRISIKPGITGLWQISGRNEITEFAEVVKLDLKYIDSWRFMKDLKILWKTVWVVLARKGAR